MRLLLDVNISPQWAEYLRAAGHHAVHWTAVGGATAPDDEIMRYAAEQGFILITRDLDFGAMLAATKAVHPSVIQLRGPRQFPADGGPRMLQFLAEAQGDLENGVFVSMDLRRTRLHILPIRPH